MGCGCGKKKQTVTAQTPNPNPTPQTSDNAWWQANPQKPSTVATPMPA